MVTPFSDLDELILKCRDEKAKSYIKEAVLSYKSGATRASIVSTWTAVSFDIIDKIKELALAGDQEAQKQVNIFETAITNKDIPRGLEFERNLLKLAKDKFELISHLESIDLARIQEDRNRCAHPSMNTDGDIFNPSGELARLHIRCAVEYLLQHPPAQGKYALSGLTSKLESDYFPQDVEDVIIMYEKSPLQRARQSLIRNFVIILIKRLIEKERGYTDEMKLYNSIKAIQILHPLIIKSVMNEKLSSLLREMHDDDLYKITGLVKKIDGFWAYIEKDVNTKIQNYFSNLPSKRFDSIESVYNQPELEQSIKKRVSRATKKEIQESLWFILPPIVGDRLIDLYLKSSSFDDANSFAPLVIEHIIDFSHVQLQILMNGILENSQILHSNKLHSVVRAIKTTSISPDKIDTFIKNIG